jgi:acyl carrier protein
LQEIPLIDGKVVVESRPIPAARLRRPFMIEEQTIKAAKRWTPEEVRLLIREIITDLAPSPEEPVPEARLIEDLGCHSLSLLELAFSLEDEFDLPTIDETTARQILTVNDVEQHVLAQLKSNGQLA